VVSGINEGQNIGPVTALSGTVGAAREAARRGIPSLGASSGVVVTGAEGEVVEYDEAVDLVVEWVEAHREELLARPDSTEPADLANLNVPTCVTGEMRGQVEVPVATTIGEGVNIFATDCTSTLEGPTDDVVAFTNGFAPLSELNVAELDAMLEAVSVNE
jgi:5'-nucleotidase